MYQTFGWENYLLIEEEFLKAKQFVDIKEDNFEVTSLFFSNKIVLLGAEIEAAFKKICSFDGINGGNMSQYKEETLKFFPKIADYKCNLSFTEYQVIPFDDWKAENGKLDWWDVYTNIKHSTVDGAATMKMAICMLSALQILLILIEAKSSSVADANGFKSAVLFQNETPKMFEPCFKRTAVLKNIGLMTTYLIPTCEVV